MSEFLNRYRYFVKMVFIFIFFFLTLNSVLYPSVFVRAGSGGVLAEYGDDGKSNYESGVPFLLGIQYAPDYRESWMLNSSMIYVNLQDNDYGNDLFIGTAGVMYIKPFYHYESNITESILKKNTCIGTLLLPLTVMRDNLNNIFQMIIPRHPFVFADLAVLKHAESDLLYGFSGGAGFTSGLVDFQFRYTQNISFNDGLNRDIYLAGLEFTLNIPLQDRFVRRVQFIED